MSLNQAEAVGSSPKQSEAVQSSPKQSEAVRSSLKHSEAVLGTKGIGGQIEIYRCVWTLLKNADHLNLHTYSMLGERPLFVLNPGEGGEGSTSHEGKA
jgi:hypothetical protein